MKSLPKGVPLIRIADSKYTHALRNLKARLDKWNRGSDLVVICLDYICADEDSFAGYRGYVDLSEGPMKHVALIKQIPFYKFRATSLTSRSSKST